MSLAEPFEILQGGRMHTIDSSSDCWDSDVHKEELPVENEAAGQQSTIKTLFEGPEKCKCCINWVEEPPADLPLSVEQQEESKRHALLVRMKKSHDQDRNSLAMDSIVVQSPHLKQLLGEVFAGYEGITPSLKRLVFKAPFQPFLWEWNNLERAIRKQKNKTAREHAQLLRTTLKAELKDLFSVSEDHARLGVVDFEHLWTIFKPGMDLYHSEKGHDCLYRLLDSSYMTVNYRQYCQVNVCCIDFDGKSFGFRTECFVIGQFEGTKSVTSLPVFPAHLHPSYIDLGVALRKRGEKFRELQAFGPCYRAYDGSVEVVDNAGIKIDKTKRMVDGRIIVDSEAYANANFSYFRVQLKPLDSASLRFSLEISDRTHHDPLGPFDIPHPMEPPKLLPPSKYVSVEVKDKDIPENLLYLCSAQVRGYSFKIKGWATFYVDEIQDVTWNDRAFDNLMLPGDYKRLIQCFVESQIRNRGMFDDVIEGKGQGIIMLLEGSPGVGKTLTAEALADKLRKPLYSISAAELGVEPHQIDSRLSMILEVAAKWDAVLLLDESDVFLEKRSSENPVQLARNETVAIFLRLLEYYRGVLFMTTNRVQAMDPAFESRIHLKIHYPELDGAAQSQIWERFVRLSRHESSLVPQDFDELARLDLNGREIRNLVKTAHLLASHDGLPLKMEHIRTVLRVTGRGME